MPPSGFAPTELHFRAMSRFYLCLLVLAGCNTGALPSAGEPDLAKLGTATVGSACTHDSDCASGVCFTAAPFTGGYCSVHIGECPAPGGTTEPCPTGSVCINPGIGATGGGDYCLKSCTTDADCRVAERYI